MTSTNSHSHYERAINTMPAFTFIATLSAILVASSVYATPIALTTRAEICGTAPSGSSSQTPLSSPSGITTAEACQAQCNSESNCLSFLFGLVNGVEECILYSVSAASIPNANSSLVAYDKTCTGVPAVVPTTANPQGLAITNVGGTTNTNNDSVNELRDLDIIARAAICGAAPSGPASGGASPYSTLQAITTLAACKAKCVAAGAESCQSYEFGNNQCMLFASAASKIPANTSDQFVVYDVNGC